MGKIKIKFKKSKKETQIKKIVKKELGWPKKTDFFAQQIGTECQYKESHHSKIPFKKNTKNKRKQEDAHLGENKTQISIKIEEQSQLLEEETEETRRSQMALILSELYRIYYLSSIYI